MTSLSLGSHSVKTFIRHTIAAGLVCISTLTQAYTFNLDGVISQCVSLCALFTITGQKAYFSFETADNLTTINATDITQASFKTQSMIEDYLTFSSGIATQANLFSDGQGKLLNGNLSLKALSTYTGIYATADINIDTGNWVMSIDSYDGGREIIAAGHLTGGDITEVPVPATAWLFSSALMIFGSIRRQHCENTNQS